MKHPFQILFFSFFILAAFTPAMAQSVQATVNGKPITSFDVDQRVKLMALEGNRESVAARRIEAIKSLIDEQLKVQEADKNAIVISQSDVDRAFVNLAKRLKMSEERLTEILNQAGVSSKSLKDRLRADLAWARVSRQVVARRVKIRQSDVNAVVSAKSDEIVNYDFILKEITFHIPQGSGYSAKARTNSANQYRRAFKDCDSAVSQSLDHVDVSVVDIGRRNSDQLPPAVAKDLIEIPIGTVSKPRVISNGVRMYAVCTRDLARDVSFAENRARAQLGQQTLGKEAEAYLNELRDNATIVRK